MSATIGYAPTNPATPYFVDPAVDLLPAHGAIRRDLAEQLGGPVGERILDAGCGTGEDVVELAALAGPEGPAVLGIDIDPRMVEESRLRSGDCGLSVEFRQADVCAMDFADGEFDGVRAKELLSECSDPDAAAAQLVRVTRPGGRIAVFEYDLDTVAVDHPDPMLTRRIVAECSEAIGHRWDGRRLAGRFLDLGTTGVTVTPHTVIMHPEHFRNWLGARLARARRSGALSMTQEQLTGWWEPLESAAGRDRFFAAVTGFAVGATC